MHVHPIQLQLTYIIKSLSFPVGLAAAVPKIELFSSLIGAISGSIISLIAPALFHTVIFWDQLQGTIGILKLARNGFLIGLGIGLMMTGTAVSIRDIINFLVNGEDGSEYVYECN